MGDTTARHFRDKLAMRVQARDHGIKIPDFGIARYEETSIAGEVVTEVPLTRSGVVVGTPGYVSPEQLLGHPATPRSDP